MSEQEILLKKLGVCHCFFPQFHSIGHRGNVIMVKTRADHNIEEWEHQFNHISSHPKYLTYLTLIEDGFYYVLFYFRCDE